MLTDQLLTGRSRPRLWVALLVAVLASGCVEVGPPTFDGRLIAAVHDPIQVTAIGDSFRAPDGLTITMGTLESFEPDRRDRFDETPAFGEYTGFVRLPVTITNQTTRTISPGAVSFDAISSERWAERVLEWEGGVDPWPETDLAPGDEVTWTLGFAVYDPQDLTLKFILGEGEGENFETVFASPRVLSTPPAPPTGARTSTDQARFGGHVTWENGQTVEVSEPRAFTPSGVAAAFQDDYDHFLVFRIRILNNGPGAVEPTSILLTPHSSTGASGEVWDLDQGLGLIPGIPLRQGGSAVQFDYGVGVDDPGQLTLTIQPDREATPVHFSR